MVYGVWCMVYGVWCMVHGVWAWCMVYRVCIVISSQLFNNMIRKLRVLARSSPHDKHILVGVWCMAVWCMVYGVWLYSVWCMVYDVWYRFSDEVR